MTRASRAPLNNRRKIIGSLARFSLRAAVSVAVVAFVLRNASLPEILSSLQQLLEQWPVVVVAVLLVGMAVLVAVYRWRVLLGGFVESPRVLTLLRASLVGGFFNQFFPSSIGGDAARGWLVREVPGSTAVSLTVVVVDRLIGVVGICVTALLAMCIRPSLFSSIPELWNLVLLSATGLAGAAFLMYPRSSRFLSRFSRIPAFKPAQDKLTEVFIVFSTLRRAWTRLVGAFGLSIVFQLVQVCYFSAVASALGIGLGFWDFAILVPIVNLVTIVPISINGIGLRETALAVLGAPFGLSVEQAVALAWAFLAGVILNGAVGGIVFLANRDLLQDAPAARGH